MHAPVPPAGQNAGFEAIAGFSSEEIYAVGWKGEIWEWNRAQWLKRESSDQPNPHWRLLWRRWPCLRLRPARHLAPRPP